MNKSCSNCISRCVCMHLEKINYAICDYPKIAKFHEVSQTWRESIRTAIVGVCRHYVEPEICAHYIESDKMEPDEQITCFHFVGNLCRLPHNDNFYPPERYICHMMR